jgi:hypothetical protein
MATPHRHHGTHREYLYVLVYIHVYIQTSLTVLSSCEGVRGARGPVQEVEPLCMNDHVITSMFGWSGAAASTRFAW